MILVYHFVLDHRIGGPHIYVETLRSALQGRVEAITVTTGKGPMTDIGLCRLRHLWSPLYALELLINFVLILWLVAIGRMQRRNAIFHVHGGATLAPIAAARVLGIPVVWTIHETISSYGGLVRIGLRILRRVPHQLVVVAASARGAYAGFDEATLIPASVDAEYWSPDKVSGEYVTEVWKNRLQDHDPVRILTVGNLNPLKGQDILLAALRHVDGPWVLKIVGTHLASQQKYTEALLDMAASADSTGPNKVVSFLGWQNKDQVRALLAGSDLFILPSRSEAYPIALLEALAMGCFCIAADVGDVSSIIAGREHAKLFSSGSVDELSSLLETSVLALSNRCNHAEYSSAEMSSLDDMSEAYLAIYTKLGKR